MGIEYKIVCDARTVASFDDFLRSQAYFDSYNAELHSYYLTEPGVAVEDNWPVVYASIKADGLYFCDNLVSEEWSARILRSLIDHAFRHSDQVVLLEL
ncbi:hypothetical protein [Luteolibacter sp. Populi]|uniref:hypothetical protein n=1 Tax=Luteolibacter sp. Populi TaxID=3230487 RepID=UPI0034662DB1